MHNLFEAARKVRRALNLTDCDLRADPRFEDQGIVVFVSNIYGIEVGDRFDVVDIHGQNKGVLFLRLPAEAGGS